MEYNDPPEWIKNVYGYALAEAITDHNSYLTRFFLTELAVTDPFAYEQCTSTIATEICGG